MVDFADFVVSTPDDRPQLVVEAKRQAGAGPYWATVFRSNLARYGALPSAPYFLLALPDQFYLWTEADEPAAPPRYTIDAHHELAPYVESIRRAPDHLSNEGFELLVQAWLDDLLASSANPQTGVPQPVLDRSVAPRSAWLVESGLADALRHGTLRIPGNRVTG